MKKVGTIVDELHKILVDGQAARADNNKPDYPSKTVDYTPELFDDIMDSFYDSWLTGYTVCGAQDPMVIELGDEFREKHPAFKNYLYVRVIDKFLNSWSSATLLEFSNVALTDEEYEQAEEILDEEENSVRDA